MTFDESIRQLVREEVQAALRSLPGPRPVGEWLSTYEAAELAGVRPKTIRAWVAAGLPCQRRGRRMVISRAALDGWRTGTPVTTALLSTLTAPGR